MLVCTRPILLLKRSREQSTQVRVCESLQTPVRRLEIYKRWSKSFQDTCNHPLSSHHIHGEDLEAVPFAYLLERKAQQQPWQRYDHTSLMHLSLVQVLQD